MQFWRTRHPVLVFFTGLADLFLIAFALDATFSVLDDAMRLSGLGSGLQDARNFVAGGVALGALLMAFVLLFVPQLPRLVLLPSIAYALWCAMGAPPLMVSDETGPILSVLQLAVALGSFVGVNMYGGRWLLFPYQLPARGHMLTRTLVALAIVFLVLPTLAVTFVLSAFTHQLETMSNRYVQFNASGIDVQETTLIKGDQTVYLVGMMHIGEPSAYNALFSSFPADALVMPEGVSDKENLLAGKFSYRRLARLLGLEQQPDVAAVENGTAPGMAGAEPDSGETAHAAPTPQPQDRRHILRADVDVSDFKPVTLKFLGDLGELYASETVGEAITRFQALSDKYSENDVEMVFDDILKNRNAHLMAAFDANAASYSSVIIPWGALHMPGLELALNERGYKAKERHTVRLVNYGTLISALLSHL